MLGPGFTLCLTHVPEDCELHQCMLTAAQAPAACDITSQVQYSSADKESLLYLTIEQTGSSPSHWSSVPLSSVRPEQKIPFSVFISVH